LRYCRNSKQDCNETVDTAGMICFPCQGASRSLQNVMGDHQRPILNHGIGVSGAPTVCYPFTASMLSTTPVF